MHSDTYHRFLTASGYMIISAIVVLSMAYLPTLAGTLLTTLEHPADASDVTAIGDFPA